MYEWEHEVGHVEYDFDILLRKICGEIIRVILKSLA